MYSKTLSINFSASKQTASPPLGETGEGFHNVEHCIFEITDPLYLPLKRGGLVCPYLECPLEVLLIVFLYNYVVNILCIKTGDGYDFYCMLKQAEIEVQSTSNRKLPNFYPSSG